MRNKLHNFINNLLSFYASFFTHRFYQIIVHKSNTFSRLASPNDNFRIITEENINKLSENIRLFCNSMISTSSINEQLINECLVKYRLDYKNIIDNYTSQFIKEKN